MKTGLLLLLSLATATGNGPAPAPVRFIPLTEAAYEAELGKEVAGKAAITRPIEKVRGRLVISTANGNRVFQDVKAGSGADNEIQHTYLGYVPRWKYHMLEVSRYEEGAYVIVTDAGAAFEWGNSPVFSPDMRRMMVLSSETDYPYEPAMRLYQLRSGAWHKTWEIMPATWDPDVVSWLSNNTLLLRKKKWPHQEASPAYTYAKMLVR